MGVECPSDFGTNLVQHFIGRYSRYQTVLSKLQEISSYFYGIQKSQHSRLWVLFFRFYIVISARHHRTPHSINQNRNHFFGRSKPLPYDIGGSICKISAVLFTFCNIYGIIRLIDKLEFVN